MMPKPAPTMQLVPKIIRISDRISDYRWARTHSIIACTAVLLLACESNTLQTKVQEHDNQAIQTHRPISTQTPKPTLIFPKGQVHIEIADTPAKRQLGLMHRTELGENSGMLFIFETKQTHCFWMKNTLIPLTIGFIDAQGILIQTQDMQPQSTETHCAKVPVQYALEMNQGWFEHNHLPIQTQILAPQPH